jgi:hypothetical protein
VARRVFFSFHYDRDVFRVNQVRNSWLLRAGNEAPPFFDKADFEDAKRRAGGIKNWIDDQLAGASVTAVLFGAETYDREWVRYEINRSFELGKGLLAIDIHRLKDPRRGADMQGRNPLQYWGIDRNGRRMTFDEIYKTYDWVIQNGYANIGEWVEAAARAAGR